MKPSIIVLSLLLQYSFSSVAQTSTNIAPPAKQIEVVGDSVRRSNAFFIGEVHGIWEGTAFKFEMIRWLHKNYGINDVVMEWGKSEAYHFNAYLQHGDTAIFAYYGRDKKILDQLSQWQALYDECGFTLHGIDFERTTFVTAVLSILNKYPETKGTMFYEYLNSITAEAKNIEDDKSGKKAFVRIYAKAKTVFENDKEKLKATLGEKYQLVAEIMENPATQKEFKKRDEMMALNISNIKTAGNGFVCILGLGHTSLRKKSVLKRYITTAPNKTATIINMVCKNCYNTSYFGSMTIDMVADYEGKNNAYMHNVFDKYYKPGFYTLVNQYELKDLPSGYATVPTYYVLFKDQPKW